MDALVSSIYVQEPVAICLTLGGRLVTRIKFLIVMHVSQSLIKLLFTYICFLGHALHDPRQHSSYRSDALRCQAFHQFHASSDRLPVPLHIFFALQISEILT